MNAPGQKIAIVAVIAALGVSVARFWTGAGPGEERQVDRQDSHAAVELEPIAASLDRVGAGMPDDTVVNAENSPSGRPITMGEIRNAQRRVDGNYHPYGDDSVEAEENIRVKFQQLIALTNTQKKIVGWRSTSGGTTSSIEKSEYAERLNRLPKEEYDALIISMERHNSILRTYADSTDQLIYDQIQRMSFLEQCVDSQVEASKIMNRRLAEAEANGSILGYGTVTKVGDTYLPLCIASSDYPVLKEIQEAVDKVRADRKNELERALDSLGV